MRTPGEVFGRTLDRLLPATPGGPAPKTLGLAGPGLAAAPETDIALVPKHPQTGRAWRLPGPAAAAPLAAEVWMHLAFHDERSTVPATGGLPAGVLRDDPPPLRPWMLFRVDGAVFGHTPARLPAVREPWLRVVYDRARDGRFAPPS